MFVVLAFVVAFATALAWSTIFLRRDKADPEPRRLVLILFVAGLLVTIPSAVVEVLISSNELVSFTVVAPLVEEGFKLAAVALICWRSRHFNQVVDGAIYGVSCAFGFAALENVLFGVGGGFGVLGARVLVGPITHPLFTGVSGLYLGRAKFERNPLLLVQGFALATLLHAGWNFSAVLVRVTDQALSAFVFLALIPVYAVVLARFLRGLSAPEAQRLRSELTPGLPSPTITASGEVPP